MFENFFTNNMVRQNLVLPYLPQNCVPAAPPMPSFQGQKSVKFTKSGKVLAAKRHNAETDGHVNLKTSGNIYRIHSTQADFQDQ